MKKIYDSSKDTMEHIITVGNYIDIIVDEIRKYKKVDITDNINKMTLIDFLILLQKGEELYIKNKLLENVYSNSRDYKLKEKYRSQEVLCKLYIDELLDRKVNHDKTKLEYPEKQSFDNSNYKLNQISYGSEDYLKSLFELRQALTHHYRYNRHHPEHFGNGIYGMNIMDLLEMICDWKASSQRQNDGDIFDGIEKQKQRFNYDNKMVKILSNTAEKYFFKN